MEVAQSEALAFLVVLLGGEAGLRCGEIMALEWTDVDFADQDSMGKPLTQKVIQVLGTEGPRAHIHF